MDTDRSCSWNITYGITDYLMKTLCAIHVYQNYSLWYIYMTNSAPTDHVKTNTESSIDKTRWWQLSMLYCANKYLKARKYLGNLGIFRNMYLIVCLPICVLFRGIARWLSSSRSKVRYGFYGVACKTDASGNVIAFSSTWNMLTRRMVRRKGKLNNGMMHNVKCVLYMKVHFRHGRRYLVISHHVCIFVACNLSAEV